MSEQAAGQPLRPAAHLQPGDHDQQCAWADEDEHELSATSLAPIEQAIADSAALPGPTDEEEQRAAENLLRLKADRARVEQLRAAGFAGPQFDLFQNMLVSYGIPVIRSWISKQLIYGLCANRGRGMTTVASDGAREYLASRAGEGDRVELALETVAMALRMFKERALEGGQWSPEKGASLATYFIGACLLAFPNVFRAWVREYDDWKRQLPFGLPDAAGEEVKDRRRSLEPGVEDDPADVAVGRTLVLEHLHVLKDQPTATAYAVAAVILQGKSYAEVADELDVTEQAVKQRLYRYRTELVRRQANRRKA
ncbi:sigma factor-like helix-turn-helix DNA-binding protein [Amycolatopsis sp. NPDC101161]|uniref:sigma-70 region 4 domain-containing protein n=1 Tax=Amycolatopsis sp. NPDC101161 TaxID=3363940 RepID=UPI0037F152CF